MGAGKELVLHLWYSEEVDNEDPKITRPKWRNGRGRKLMLEHRRRARRRRRR